MSSRNPISHTIRVAIGIIAVMAAAVVLPVASAPTAGAQGMDSSFCADGAAEPCVESATLNGVAVDASHPDYDILVIDRDVAGADAFYWAITSTTDDGFDIGAGALGGAWSLTIRSSVDPRFVFVHGTPGTITRGAGTVTIESSPVVITNGCDPSTWPWTCPESADTDWDALFDGEVTDFGQWNDADQRESFRGYDMFTNIDVTSVPVEIGADPTTGDARLLVRLANSHFRVDGVTPVTGFMTQRIPAAFLDQVYGIDDPASLTATGVDTTLSGTGAGTVSASVDGDALVVEATGLTFSRRVVRIDAGTITPTKAKRLDATRSTQRRARITFRSAKARGSSITRHVTRCRQISGSDVAWRRTGPNSQRVVVRGLEEGSAYRCRIRAISTAGPGRWSKPVSVAPTV